VQVCNKKKHDLLEAVTSASHASQQTIGAPHIKASVQLRLCLHMNGTCRTNINGVKIKFKHYLCILC